LNIYESRDDPVTSDVISMSKSYYPSVPCLIRCSN